jgi:hypothetical protein
MIVEALTPEQGREVELLFLMDLELPQFDASATPVATLVVFRRRIVRCAQLKLTEIFPGG